MRFICLPTLILFLLAASLSRAAARMPSYEDFPAVRGYSGPSRAPILDTPGKYAYRTRLRAAAQKPADFAGEYVLEHWGCGTSCEQFAIVNKRTGVVYMPPFSTQGGETLYPETNTTWERLEWKPNSRLLVINGQINEQPPDAHHYYVFDGHELNYLAKSQSKPMAADPPKTSAKAETPPSEPKTEEALELPSAFIGRWSSSYAQCRDETDGVTHIEKKKLTESEHGCVFTKFEHDGDTWTVVADCEGEGEKWASRIELKVSEDTLLKRYDKQQQTSLLRCP